MRSSSTHKHTYSNTPWEDRLDKESWTEHGVSATIMPPFPCGLHGSTVCKLTGKHLPSSIPRFPAFPETLEIGGRGDTNAVLRKPIHRLTGRTRSAVLLPRQQTPLRPLAVIIRACLFSLLLPNSRGYVSRYLSHAQSSAAVGSGLSELPKKEGV
jgi:hypothetical protein